MSDDWSTKSMRRDQALGQEIEGLRKRYLEHSALLEKMIAGAPNDHLIREYTRLREEIDATVRKLDELGRGVGDAPVWQRGPATDTAQERLGEASGAWSPARSELRPEPPPPTTDRGTGTGARVLAIALAGIAVLAILAFLVWRLLSGAPRGREEITEVRPTAAATDTIVQSTPPETAAPPPAVATVAPPPQPAGLALQPDTYDYGVIRKGTRATHQFRVVNNLSSPLTVQVSRSACHCLWFEYPSAIPAGGTAALTITVDGARAKAGLLRETVRVSSRADPSLAKEIAVTATIR